jgi:hypothetical protein
MVNSYDLITETASLSTISSPLLLNGKTGFSVITPDDYVQKIYKLIITNSGSATATVTLTANSNIPGLLSYTVAIISIPAGDTQVFSEHDFDIILTAGYNLDASISAGTGAIQALAYFEK